MFCLKGNIFVLTEIFVLHYPIIHESKFIFILKSPVLTNCVSSSSSNSSSSSSSNCAVMNGCETWSLILRKEHSLSLFEDRVMRIFGPRREEVMEDWRRLHNEELHNLYAPSNIIRVIK